MSPSPLRWETLSVGHIAANCHLLHDEDTRGLLVIDPGGDGSWILESIARYAGFTTEIWLTHAHIDHIGALAEVARQTGAPVWVHAAEKDWLTDPALSLASLLNMPMEPWNATGLFQGGEQRRFLGRDWTVHHVPGHSPGSVAFHCAAADLVIAGDVLFRGSVGRTDLPSGDPRVLSRSIRHLYANLPLETRVLCGHGPDTTLAIERENNPYVSLILGGSATG